MRPGPFAPHERPKKKYTARSYSRSTLRPPNRYSASPPRTAVTIMSIDSSSSGRERFPDHRRPLTASDAGGAQAETLAPAPQGVEQVDGDARAGRSERVTDRDGTAVHIGLGAVEPQLLLDGEVLGRKRLVHLDEIELLELHPSLLQRHAGEDFAKAHGSTPATAHATRRPSGFKPCALAKSSPAITVAAAPSTIPDALPAVTSPSFLK